MKTPITAFVKIGFICTALVVVSSCNSNSEEKTESKKEDVKTTSKTQPIVRKWSLADDPQGHDKATKVVLSIEESGYFIIYDTIIDPKFAQAGISKIQPISKGQWNLKDKKLTLNHLQADSSRSETFQVADITDKKLIIIGANNKKHTYIAY